MTLFYLDAALALSPSNKAIVELLNHRVCIVHQYYDDGKIYTMTVIDLERGKETMRNDVLLMHLDAQFDHLMTEQGVSISAAKRLWMPLEWWQHPTN